MSSTFDVNPEILDEVFDFIKASKYGWEISSQPLGQWWR